MAIGRVVPWSNWEQWSAVYRGLFADDAAQQSVALQQVGRPPHPIAVGQTKSVGCDHNQLCLQLSVWRCRGTVPLAVDVTACLIEINVRSSSDASSSS